ncbi:2'-5' RNA ligase family protein [Sphingosinicella sp.]|uniref:2'-5' RNA ligase family protein n=1 Tax=Sphingosinicella sp. TaxID=1917971 RepID=UPI0040376D05
MDVLHRYFFALQPPESLARRAATLRDAFAENGGIVRSERLHVTLGITDDYAERPAPVVDRLLAIGEAIDAEPFVVALDRLSGCGRTIALRPSRTPPGLTALQRQIDTQMRYWNVRRPGWTFNPHMTLVYRPHQEFLRPIEALVWEATELVLVHSLVGRTQHTALGRWPLRRRQMELSGV